MPARRKTSRARARARRVQVAACRRRRAHCRHCGPFALFSRRPRHPATRSRCRAASTGRTAGAWGLMRQTSHVWPLQRAPMWAIRRTINTGGITRPFVPDDCQPSDKGHSISLSVLSYRPVPLRLGFASGTAFSIVNKWARRCQPRLGGKKGCAFSKLKGVHLAGERHASRVGRTRPADCCIRRGVRRRRAPGRGASSRCCALLSCLPARHLGAGACGLDGRAQW